jgi:hypothetical protein
MLTNITFAERERIAYTEGFTEAASLLAQLADLQLELEEAAIDRDLYLEALDEIYRGLKIGTMTSNQAMMLAARVLP